MLLPGEIVTVRAHAGMRADEEPRAVVVAGTEMPVEGIEWRAVTERLDGTRRRAFVCTVAGRRLRLEVDDEGTWQIARLM